jgi:hypothetical protein
MKIRNFQIIFALITILKINANDSKNVYVKSMKNQTNSGDVKVKWQGYYGNWANHCDFPDDDNNIIKVVKCLGEDCGFWCDRTRECTHFVYNNSVCTLKSGIVTKSDAIINPNLNMCGLDNSYMKFNLKNCTGHNKTCTYNGILWTNDGFGHGCEYRGNDFMVKKIDGERCWQLCESTPGCSHYTWDYDTSLCYLKKSARQVFREDAIEVGDLEMLCGVIDFDEVNETCNSEGHASVGFDLTTVYPDGDVCKVLDFFLKQKHMHMPFSSGE